MNYEKKRVAIFYGLLDMKADLNCRTNPDSGFCLKKAYEIFSEKFEKELSAVPDMDEEKMTPDEWHEIAKKSVDYEDFKSLILNVIQRWENGEFFEEEEEWIKEWEAYKAEVLSE